MAEPLNAAFFAFKKREPGGVVLRASAAFVVIALLLIGAFVAVFWSSLLAALDWYVQVLSAVVANDEQALASIAFPVALLPVFLGLIGWSFFFYLLCAAYESACLRWFVHGESSGFMGLSLGAETLRVWGVYWIWFGLNIAFSIVAELTSMALGGMAIVAAGDAAVQNVVRPILEFVQLIVVIYFGVRLAPAAATSIARRRFSFFEAWSVTKGRFWPLLGAFALVYAIYFVASIAFAIVAVAVLLGEAMPVLSGNPEQMALSFMRAWLAALTEPRTWIAMGALQVIGMIGSAVFYVAMFGINARAAQAALQEGKIESGSG